MFDFLSKAGGSLMDGLGNMGSAVGSGLGTMGEYAGKGLSHTFERLQDPEVQQQLHLLGAVMSDDQNRYQGALNAYEKRRGEIASQKREDARRAEDRKLKLEDMKEQRQYSEQQDWLKGYTPDSVQIYRESGDQTSLVKNPVKMEFRREQDRGGNTYEVQIDPNTGMDVEGGVRRAVGYAAPKAAIKSRTQVIDGVLYEEFGAGDWRPVVGTSTSQIKEQKALDAKTQQASEAAVQMFNTADATFQAVTNITAEDVKNVGGYSAVGGMWSEGSKTSAAKFNQVLSQQFMQNISQMKGMGALSNAEGSKVTGAATALVDPETNTIRLGLSEKFVQEQLDIIKKGATSLKKIAEFYQKNGREPNIDERKSMGVYSDSKETGAIDWPDLK